VLGHPQKRANDITDLYVQQYGTPEPGQKVFIRTRQQHNGWEGPDHDLSEVVPARRPAPAWNTCEDPCRACASARQHPTTRVSPTQVPPSQ
jgi:hypothetical protein